MRKLLPIMLAVGVLFGIGCFTQPQAPESSEVTVQEAGASQTEHIEQLLGLVESVHVDQRFFTISLPEGGREDLVVPEGRQMDSIKKGMLIEVSGERERSTRIIEVENFRLVTSSNIQVTSPAPGSTVTSPLVVFGYGRSSDRQVSWRIRSANARVIQRGYASIFTEDSKAFGPFRFEIFLPVLDEDTFTLELYRETEEGYEEDLVVLPLKRLSEKTSIFKVYFPSPSKTDACDSVVAVEREVAETSALARAAVSELLAGPDPQEQREGLVTLIPFEAKPISISVNEGVATVIFTSQIEEIKSVCEKDGVMAQIRETLLQFDSVREVRITTQESV